MSASARHFDVVEGGDHAANYTPVGGPVLNRFTRLLLVVIVAGGLATAWRFIAGLGATTGLSDGYPWGIWIAFDVVTGTALATGGYALALLVYILNRGQYHPLVRPAILTSALGYSMAGLAITIDVGRYWNVWKIPLFWGNWNLNSPLLEVALCVMAYIIVLYLELAPALMEKWRTGVGPLASISRSAYPGLMKALPWIIGLGITLPTMHQSSLGAVFLLPVLKAHKLWHTPLLPFLFLVSVLGMGYAVVIIESTLSARFFGRKSEGTMLAKLSLWVVYSIVVYIVVRWVDLIARGRLGLAFTDGMYSIFFWLEMVCFVMPLALLASPARRANAGYRLMAALGIGFAGALYRFDTYLVGFRPGPGWHYFPAVPELLVTFGIIALETLVYIWVVKRFPILGGAPAVKAKV